MDSSKKRKQPDSVSVVQDADAEKARKLELRRQRARKWQEQRASVVAPAPLPVAPAISETLVPPAASSVVVPVISNDSGSAIMSPVPRISFSKPQVRGRKPKKAGVVLQLQAKPIKIKRNNKLALGGYALGGFDSMSDSDSEAAAAQDFFKSFNSSAQSPVASVEGEDPAAKKTAEVDSLQAFMDELQRNAPNSCRDMPTGRARAGKALTSPFSTMSSSRKTSVKKRKNVFGELEVSQPSRFFEDDEALSEDELEAVQTRLALKEKQKQKRRILADVDHDTVDYPDFRKNFYIQAKEITSMTEEQVIAYRAEELEDVKVRGEDCPRPLKHWSQCGFSKKILAVITRENFADPFPIQCQAMPAIMLGRDVIGVAKTGSGKTLAFVLPLLRHVLDQPAVEAGDGPVALIIAPTRELCLQIDAEVRKFGKNNNIRNAAVYGGGPMAKQISNIKSGIEVITCTPGRMIDLLSANGGKVTNLRRCTFLVLDEADRMFDMGFEPQIAKIVNNIRPDRQTVMFSATFPVSVEKLARSALRSPIRIIVGKRNTGSTNVRQLIEIQDPPDKYSRLLEILGKWYQTGNILIFDSSKQEVDALHRRLTNSGYPCYKMHGGMDQTTRDYAISDFKNKLRTVMVASSIIARGLDVKDLALVVNYSICSNYEDYVHRIGRTGRAGKRGTAITFLTSKEQKYTPKLVQGLKASKQKVPAFLRTMAKDFLKKKKEGKVEGGYGFSSGLSARSGGYKFDDNEEDLRELARLAKIPAAEKSEELLEKERLLKESVSKAASKKEVRRKSQPQTQTRAPSDEKSSLQKQMEAAKVAMLAATQAMQSDETVDQKTAKKLVDSVLQRELSKADPTALKALEEDAAAKAKKIALDLQAAMNVRSGLKPTAELEVNDYPQLVRWKLTKKESIEGAIGHDDVEVLIRGTFVPPGRKPQDGDRKLHLLIIGPSQFVVDSARANLQRFAEEVLAGMNAEQQQADPYARYNILG